MTSSRKLAFTYALFALLTTQARAVEKVAICHVPPGDPANAQTIEVSTAAVPAHLAHGDSERPCGPVCTSNGGDCSDGSECCSGVCSGEGICAAECTIGPELGGAYCDENLPCCDGVGVCIFGACFDESIVTCDPHVGGYCDVDSDPQLWCCFDHNCIKNECQPSS